MGTREAGTARPAAAQAGGSSPGMDRVFAAAASGRRAPTLMILLPGAYDTPADFVREGFVDAVRRRGLALDMLLLDAHVDYYLGGQVLELLRNEVRAARARGYERVWLAGISLGGHGALLLASRHGAEIDGVLVLAAFLGRRDLPSAVARAGGLASWDGVLATADPDDLVLWRWLRGRLVEQDPARPAVWLGYGEDDRFIASNRLLAAELPAEQVLRTAGGHAWEPWRELWERFLDARPWLRD